jgi:hypothetical protein
MWSAVRMLARWVILVPGLQLGPGFVPAVRVARSACDDDLLEVGDLVTVRQHEQDCEQGGALAEILWQYIVRVCDEVGSGMSRCNC